NTPAALRTFLLPPHDRLCRLIIIRVGQCLSPRAAAKRTDVAGAPGIGPLAKRQQFAARFLVIADEFEGRTRDAEMDLMPRQQSGRSVLCPPRVHGPLR